MIGYFGKLPAHGDFVARGLPPGLVTAWDTWLQQCIHESRRQLGEQWLTHYLTSPVWRFAIPPGILGPEGLGGVMMPSVDRVGRYFPLMIGATGAPPLLDWFQKHAAWYDGIEEAARASLDREFSLARLAELAGPGVPSAASGSPGGRVRRFSYDPAAGERIVAAALQDRSLWWTTGALGVEASVLMCTNLPRPEAFAAMLNGDWAFAERL